MPPETFIQEAPYPYELETLIEGLDYKPGWDFYLYANAPGPQCRELTFQVLTYGYDTYHPENGEGFRVAFYFKVPAVEYNRASWQRWLYERCCDVERHETMESFQINGRRPYAPNHVAGNDPYFLYDCGQTIEPVALQESEIQKEIVNDQTWR